MKDKEKNFKFIFFNGETQKWGVILGLSGVALLLLGVILVNLYFKQGKDGAVSPQNRVVTPSELKREMERLKRINAYPSNKKIDPQNYPIVLGPYSENGLVLVEKYFCSDLCPDNARVVVVFRDITSQKECARVGGRDLIDPAWGGYLGCAPKVN